MEYLTVNVEFAFWLTFQSVDVVCVCIYKFMFYIYSTINDIQYSYELLVVV